MSEGVVSKIPECPDWLIHELNKILKNQELAESALVDRRQDEIARVAQTGRRSVNGLGRPVMEIDEYVLAHWRHRLGHNPLKDSGWKKYMLKHHPEIRVHAMGTKEIMVGYGSKSFGVTKRFSKTY